MQIKTLLDQADRCTFQEDVPALCSAIREALGQTALFSRVKFEEDTRFDTHEASVSEVGAHVHMRFYRRHSDFFVTGLSVIISEEGFVIEVITSYCTDGFESRHSLDGMDDDSVEPQPDDTLEDVMVKARELAVTHQRKLLEMVGVPENLSADIAEKLW